MLRSLDNTNVCYKPKIEQRLAELADLRRQANTIEMQIKEVHKILIETYFKFNEFYYDNRGVLLAHYKPVTRMQVDIKRMTWENPSLVDRYTKPSTHYRLDIK